MTERLYLEIHPQWLRLSRSRAEAFQTRLESEGILKHGHHVGKSGEHLGPYIEKRVALSDTKLIEDAVEIAAKYLLHGIFVDAIIGPVSGGAMFAIAISLELGRMYHHRIRVCSAKIVDGKVEVWSGLRELVRDKSVLIVDDNVNTGYTTRLISSCLRMELGASAVYVLCMCNRMGKTGKEIGADELFNICNFDFPSWPEEECPLCKENTPVCLEHGHGSEWAAKNPLYPTIKTCAS